MMDTHALCALLESSPVIAAVTEERFRATIESPAAVLFHLRANLLHIKEQIDEAHRAGKCILVHLDLAEGIGKDRVGIDYLRQCGVDGILTTRGQLVRQAKELGLPTVQRFFALDSQGVAGIHEQLQNTRPDLMEIMPGTVGKVLAAFAATGIPVIAGGLIETKAEITTALSSGAVAVSTGKKELWYV